MSFAILNSALSTLRLPIVTTFVRQQAATLTTSLSATPKGPVAGGAWALIATRTNIRNNFPRAREGKRVKLHGWWKRMSTVSGRRVLMRRILKGRHVLSH